MGNNGFNLDFLQPGYGYQGMVNQPTGNFNDPTSLDFTALTGGGGGSDGGVGNGGITDGMFGKAGWGNLALGGANSLMQGYLGFQQLQMAKDQLDSQKKAFNKNFNSQKRLTNANLRDRQKRRYYENPDYYQKPDQYMAQNGVQ